MCVREELVIKLISALFLAMLTHQCSCGRETKPHQIFDVYLWLYMWRNKNNSAHKSTGYHLLFKLKLQTSKKLSVFNKSETAHVTFDPVSINASEKEVLLPAFYLKQRDVGQEVLPMRSLPESFMQLLLIHWKTVHMDFMYSFQTVKHERKINNSDISNAPVLYDRWKPHNLSLHHPSVAYSEFCALIFCAHSSHSRSLSHATTWVLWIAFLSVR